jgi:hypothetical protein
MAVDATAIFRAAISHSFAFSTISEMPVWTTTAALGQLARGHTLKHLPAAGAFWLIFLANTAGWPRP